MGKSFKRGDVVEWNSEAGRVRGPQYLIKSVKTDHIAMHKGQALTHVRRKTR